MSLGLWSVPAVVAGLFSLLWITTWLDRLVGPPPLEVELDAEVDIGHRKPV
jgi:hypothetical protein